MWYMNEEREMMQSAIREFAVTKVRPHVEAMENEDAGTREILKELGELGFLQLAVPEKYSGIEPDWINWGIMMEELAKESPAVAFSVLCANMFPKYMSDEGALTDEQVEKFLMPSLTGEKLFGIAGCEPDGGAFGLNEWKATAELDGDEWVLNGSKIFITNADVVDYILFRGQMIVNGEKKGVGMFAVPTDDPGYRVGHVENKVGLNGSRTAAVYFENVRVPEINHIKEFSGPSAGIDIGGYGFFALGAGERMLEMAKEMTKNTLRNGVSLWDAHESIQYMLGSIKAKLMNLRNACYGYCADMNAGNPMASLEAFALKIEGDKLIREIASECIGVVGGTGVVEETGFARYYRDGICMLQPCGSDKTYATLIGQMA